MKRNRQVVHWLPPIGSPDPDTVLRVLAEGRREFARYRPGNERQARNSRRKIRRPEGA